MRIVHLTTSGDLGGAETSLLAILGSVRQAEPHWTLSVIAPACGRLLHRLDDDEIRARVLPFPPALARLGESSSRSGAFRGIAAAVSGAAYAARLRSALVDERADVVHAHGFKMHVLAALAGPRRRALIWHVHGYLSGRRWTEAALRALASRPSAVVANSASVAADVRRVLGPRALVRTLYNAVDLRTFAPGGPRLDLDAAAGLPPAPDGTVRVGLVGTFGRWKGHHVFLDALARLPAAAPVRGYIVGAPIYATTGSQFTFEQLRQAAGERGLSGRVGFSGFVADVAGAMRSLDIVVHASTEPEPFGMVIAEAMACGRPVVASRAGGAAELFEDGVDGFGHAPGDAGELAQIIAALAADPVRRERVARAARRAAEVRFDRRRLADSLVPLYRTLAEA